MRVYGRTTNEEGVQTWVTVETDPNGHNDMVNLTWLAQVLKLNLNESPFYANWGIPQIPTIVSQVFPDYYVMQTQQQFRGIFASLSMYRVPASFPPEYNVQIMTQYGAILSTVVAT